MQRAQQGDRSAFAELYRRYAKLIYSRVLLPKLGQAAAAEDALAETFRLGLERLGSYEARTTSVYFWFARIAANKALDMHRARNVTGRALVNVRERMLPLLDAPLPPEEALDERQQLENSRTRIAACLDALNPRYKEAVQLRFVSGLSREECAERLEVKLGTFDVLLLRALRAFRKQWDILSEEATT